MPIVNRPVPELNSGWLSASALIELDRVSFAMDGLPSRPTYNSEIERWPSKFMRGGGSGRVLSPPQHLDYLRRCRSPTPLCCVFRCLVGNGALIFLVDPNRSNMSAVR